MDELFFFLFEAASDVSIVIGCLVGRTNSGVNDVCEGNADGDKRGQGELFA